MHKEKEKILSEDTTNPASWNQYSFEQVPGRKHSRGLTIGEKAWAMALIIMCISSFFGILLMLGIQ